MKMRDKRTRRERAQIPAIRCWPGGRGLPLPPAVVVGRREGIPPHDGGRTRGFYQATRRGDSGSTHGGSRVGKVADKGIAAVELDGDGALLHLDIVVVGGAPVNACHGGEVVVG